MLTVLAQYLFNYARGLTMSSVSDQSAFVPGFKYDVFVSYAKVDDIPDIDSQPGWVTNLVRKLSSRLAQKLGGQENFKLWMDRKQEDGLGGNKPIGDEILGTLEGTAVMIVIMSPAYLKREWCQLELAAFSEAIQQVQLTNGRIFIVERECVDQAKRPPQLQNLAGYRFWIDMNGEGHRTLGIPVPSAEERQYWDGLNGLSAELTKQLHELKEAVKETSPDGETVAAQADDLPTVFLAEATDDLYYVRKQVVEYLDQAGFRVVPSATEQYPLAEEEFRAAVQRDLEACNTVCVQLLSGVPSRYQKFVEIQNEMAAASGKKLLQWRSRDVDLSQIDDPQLRDLLDSETVLAVGIEEFKKTIVERAHSAAKARQRAESASETSDAPVSAIFLRVSGIPEDADLLNRIQDVLKRHHVSYDAGEIEDLEEELKFVFETCDGLIIPYGKADVKEVEKRLRACRIQMFRHNRKPLLAVYQASEEKPSPGISMPGMRVLRNGEQVNEQELLKFINELGQKAAESKPAGA